MALLSCPECKQNISDQATACPHCGHPIRTTISKNKFTQDVEDVKTVGAWLAFFITLPTLAVPAIISTLLDNPSELNEEAIKTLWDTFLLTAPLTCAVAIVGVWLPVVLKRCKHPYRAYQLVGIGGLFSLWLAAQISKSLLNVQGIDVVSTMQSTRSEGFQIQASLWNVVVNYFHLYGAYKFVSSWAIGIFLAWIWNRKFLTYFRN